MPMRPARHRLTTVVALAAAALGTGCGEDEPVAGGRPAEPFEGPYLESLTRLERGLEDAGVDPRRTGPAPVARRSLPRALRSETLVTSGGTRMSVLVYGDGQNALAARASVRKATPGQFTLEKVDNLLVVVTARAPDTPEVRSVLSRLETE
jgi:hypothetical protein